MSQWRQFTAEIDYSGKNILQVLDIALKIFVEMISKPIEAKHPEQNEPDSVNVNNKQDETTVEITETRTDGVIHTRTSIYTNVSTIGSGFKMPGPAKQQEDGTFIMGHLSGKNPRHAELRFSTYRDNLLAHIDVYKQLSAKESLTDAEKDFMKKVEQEFEEAKGYNYFDANSTLK